MSKKQLLQDSHNTDCLTKRKARTIADCFQKAETHQSQRNSSFLLDVEACVPIVSFPEAGRDELEARYAKDHEMSPEIEQPMALTTSNANPGPESVAKTSHRNGVLDVGDLVEVSVTSEKLESVICRFSN